VDERQLLPLYRYHAIVDAVSDVLAAQRQGAFDAVPQEAT